MFKSVKQVRSAISLLSPESVRATAERQLVIGLVAGSEAGYRDLEDFLVSGDAAHATRQHRMDSIHRILDADAPAQFDLVLCEPGVACPHGGFVFQRDDPQSTILEILRAHDSLSLPLARQFPVFRKTVVDRLIQSVATENALFAIATALPNIVPNLLELPWAIGEFASDTAFLTLNQFRMAFLIAAACGKDIGFSNQKFEMLTIGAGAFGWRALARELAGKIPLGGGLIPKGAIAYAGTLVVGKGLEKYHYTRVPLNRSERDELYRGAYERGKLVAESLSKDAG